MHGFDGRGSEGNVPQSSTGGTADPENRAEHGKCPNATLFISGKGRLNEAEIVGEIAGIEKLKKGIPDERKS